MSLYRCEKYGCVENTALGHYWSRNDPRIWPAEYVGKALCSECGPPQYNDGSKSKFGVWHGMFKKESANGRIMDTNGFLYRKIEDMPRLAIVAGIVGIDVHFGDKDET